MLSSDQTAALILDIAYKCVLSKQVFFRQSTRKHVEISFYGNRTWTTDDVASGCELKQTFTMV